MEKIDSTLYKDGYMYNLLEPALNKERDMRNINEEYSPEELLAQPIWHIPK